jgi:putative tricarboxylic transport membrane protein
MKRLGGDFWSGLALGGLGAYIVAQAARWDYLGSDGPGPGFFPLWYGIAIVALSLALVISSLRSKDSEAIEWAGAGRAFATWAVFAACVALLKMVGFYISLGALTFFIVAVMYRRPLRVAATVTAAIAAAFYVVFPLALGVALP